VYAVEQQLATMQKRLSTLEDALTRLLNWEQYMGGWESTVWDQARRALELSISRHPDDEPFAETMDH
jgi:hypothetical protein